MNQRANDVRDRINKRKNSQLRNLHHRESNVKTTYQYGDVEYTKDNVPNEKKELESGSFLIRLFVSILLIAIIAIVFQLQQKPFDIVQNKITQVMEKEFKFAVISNWYESRFGEPLTFFQENTKLKNDTEVIQASGKVLENFQTNGQGIMIETTVTKVESLEEGLVIYAGEKEELGNTVIVQNVDGSETWYGKLDSIAVNVYDEVNKGEVLASAVVENELSTYYLAVKQNEEFVDPNQVISFE